MKIVDEIIILNKGTFAQTQEWNAIQREVREAISAVTWPEGSSTFTINPIKKGNGVKPIKTAFVSHLREQYGWEPESGRIDLSRDTSRGRFAIEWETGNISSSHRAVNKMALGLLQGTLVGGALILPSRSFYRYLTDRIGNYEELQLYFPVWGSLPINDGLLAVIVVEHDAEDESVPRITKMTDGRALR